MAGPWRVKFANPDSPVEGESVANYIARIGYVPWRVLADSEGIVGVAAMCPYCGAQGVVGLDPRISTLANQPNIWTWNGDRDRPTLTPSVHYTDSGFACRFHCWVRDGQIIDAGTPAH